MPRFSIRHLLVATAAVAAGFAAVRIEPTWKSSLAMDCLTVVFATIALVGVLHGMRPFWIGTAAMLCFGLIVAALSLWQVSAFLSYENGHQRSELVATNRCLLVVWCASPVNGLLAASLRWLIWPRSPET
ncbi:MAG TPA: hypothetical protein VHC22_29440 [Pirellulales bacterium]|nr:hypothetical protein [Pirellulales bacterium]